jgi:hypothetical protein
MTGFSKLVKPCLGLGCGVSIAVLFLFNPATHHLFPLCPFHWLTRLYCPGCGSLRATHLLLRGHVGAAMRMNLLMVLFLPVLPLLAIWPRWRPPAWFIWTTLAVVILFGIARNIPAWPFQALAPH